MLGLIPKKRQRRYNKFSLRRKSLPALEFPMLQPLISHSFNKLWEILSMSMSLSSTNLEIVKRSILGAHKSRPAKFTYAAPKISPHFLCSYVIGLMEDFYVATKYMKFAKISYRGRCGSLREGSLRGDNYGGRRIE